MYQLSEKKENGSRPVIQTSLKIGQPGDKYEQEADAVADRVMRMSETETMQMQPVEEEEIMQPKLRMQPVEEEESIQMKCDKCEKDEEMLQTKSGSGEKNASPLISQKIQNSKGNGKALSSDANQYMSSAFGNDFSGVQIHTGFDAVQMNQKLGARAFTVGNDIYFNEGEYNPNSGEGKHLLAHELAHTVQQGAALKPVIQKQDAGVPACPSETALNTIEANYRSMITDARTQGYTVAADNLEHWLTGGGSALTLTTTWLRSFSSLLDAERVNQQRFENSLNTESNGMSSGSSRSFNDHWDRQLTASVFEELYYASGTSTITSTGDFNLTRTGDTVAIDGTVEHHWHDPYDWHAGLSAFIPGHGNISDSDALILERCRGASSFQMSGDWTQTLSGSIDIGYIWNTKSFTWTGP